MSNGILKKSKNIQPYLQTTQMLTPYEELFKY